MCQITMRRRILGSMLISCHKALLAMSSPRVQLCDPYLVSTPRGSLRYDRQLVILQKSSIDRRHRSFFAAVYKAASGSHMTLIISCAIAPVWSKLLQSTVSFIVLGATICTHGYYSKENKDS
jgi:hypothetical protein